MTWQQLQEYLIGKLFLIGLTFLDENDVLIEQYQTYGTVTELTDEGLLKILRNDGNIFQIPYDSETIKSAQKGEYRLRSTNEIVIDPDFIMTWEITSVGDEHLELVKKSGFIP